MSLFQRRATVEPRPTSALREEIRRRPAQSVHSYWGHENTLQAAGDLLGVSVVPRTPRPSLHLDQSGFPSLDGQSFSEVWVLTARFPTGFRPAANQELALGDIESWHVVHIQFEEDSR